MVMIMKNETKEFTITCIQDGGLLKVVVQAKSDDEAQKVFNNLYKDATMLMISSNSNL
jgi:hypothetical protein